MSRSGVQRQLTQRQKVEAALKAAEVAARNEEITRNRVHNLEDRVRLLEAPGRMERVWKRLLGK